MLCLRLDERQRAEKPEITDTRLFDASKMLTRTAQCSINTYTIILLGFESVCSKCYVDSTDRRREVKRMLGGCCVVVAKKTSPPLVWPLLGRLPTTILTSHPLSLLTFYNTTHHGDPHNTDPGKLTPGWLTLPFQSLHFRCSCTLLQTHVHPSNYTE